MEPILVRAGQAELLGTEDVGMRLLADGGTPGAVSTIRTRMAQGQTGPPPHFHANAPEMFFILDGRLDVLVGERIVTAGTGDLLVVPAGLTHAFRTPADSGVDMLFMMSGAERFDYFRLTDRVRRGLAEPTEILDTQERFDNHFLDSPVWNRYLAGAPVAAG